MTDICLDAVLIQTHPEVDVFCLHFLIRIYARISRQPSVFPGLLGSIVVKALCYKLEGRGFKTRKVNEFCFNLPNPSGRTILLGFIQPLTEMSTRSRGIMFLRIRARSVRRAENLTVFC
jgi:hypothetical protein